MTAGLILALMITPIVTSLSRDALASVPDSDKAAALALGATRWEALRAAVFPKVSSGLVAAALLGLGRALGETILVALVMGSSPQITAHLLSSGSSMAGTIALNFGEATGLHRAALMGLGVVLFAVTMAVNVGARSVLRRSERRFAA
jgi:phosphate transport system permease protein